MNYVEVQRTDTLEGIAAAHDCTVGGLVKLNKLTSRMVIFLLFRNRNPHICFPRSFPVKIFWCQPRISKAELSLPMESRRTSRA